MGSAARASTVTTCVTKVVQTLLFSSTLLFTGAAVVVALVTVEEDSVELGALSAAEVAVADCDELGIDEEEELLSPFTGLDEQTYKVVSAIMLSGHDKDAQLSLAEL